MNPTRSLPLLALLSAASPSCSAARSSASPSESAAVQPSEAQRVSAEPAPSGAVPTGKYRNLFAEIGKSARDVDARLSDAYQRLFHGSADEALMFDAGSNERGPLAYIHDIGNDDVRSEGMSYGMMIAVQYDRKNDFDALWNWSKTHMQVTRAAHPVSGYFA
jgi:oligosaccharide reducing-end xylanase